MPEGGTNPFAIDPSQEGGTEHFGFGADLFEDPKNESERPEPLEGDTEESETSAEETKGRFQSLAGGFREKASNFIKKFKGEHVEEDQSDTLTKTQLAKSVSVGALSVAASLGGFKSLHDVPAWFMQKYTTSREKEQLMNVFTGSDALGILHQEDIEKIRSHLDEYDRQNPDATTEQRTAVWNEEYDAMLVEKRTRGTQDRIRDSKFLSEEKKAELIAKVHEINEKHVKATEDLETQEHEEVAQLLDEYIQTRVKGTTALKEAMNTALIGTGLATLRGLGYGAMALVERAKRVREEQESGERTEGFAKELVVNGFKETYSKLTLKEGTTKKEKALNFIQAATTVSRFVGFTGLATAELSGEGGVSGAIDGMLSSLEEKGAAEHVSDSFSDQLNKVTFGLVGEKTTKQAVSDALESNIGGESVEGSGDPELDALLKESEEIVSDIGSSDPELDALIEESKEVAPEPTEAEKAGAAGEDEDRFNEDGEVKDAPAAEEPTEAAPDAPEAEEEPRFSKEQLEQATIKKGDGIIRVAQRQLADDPRRFGYDGDINNETDVKKWVRKTAFVAAKKAGFIQKGGWTGLGGKGIDSIAVAIEPGKDGAIDFSFVDSDTGEEADMEELRAKRIVYDYKHASGGPDAAASGGYHDTEARLSVPDEAGEEAEVESEDEKPKTVKAPGESKPAPPQPEAPTQSAPEAEKPNLDDVPKGDVEVVNRASAEAVVDSADNIAEKAPVADQAVNAQAPTEHKLAPEDVPAGEKPPYETSESPEPDENGGTAPADKFTGWRRIHGGKVQGSFQYKDGKVTDVVVYFADKGAASSDGMDRWGLSRSELVDAYKPGWLQNSSISEGRADSLAVKMGEATRGEDVLKLMEQGGQKGTPEYKLLLAKTKRLMKEVNAGLKDQGLTDKIIEIPDTDDVRAAEAAPVARPVVEAAPAPRVAPEAPEKPDAPEPEPTKPTEPDKAPTKPEPAPEPEPAKPETESPATKAEIGRAADKLSPIVETPDKLDKDAFAKLLAKQNVPKEQIAFLLQAHEGRMHDLDWAIKQIAADKAAIASLDLTQGQNAQIAERLQQRVDHLGGEVKSIIEENATEEGARIGKNQRKLEEMIRRMRAGKPPTPKGGLKDI